MGVFFVADSHFGHENAIKYCSRPFANVEEMDDALIALWNGKVGKNATVYHLGDFAFVNKPAQVEAYLQRLNGHKVLIMGGHDRKKVISKVRGFQHVTEPLQDYQLKIDGMHLHLSHTPRLTWEKQHYGAVHLFGHCHGMLKHPYPNAFDVGVDCNGYMPVSLEEVKSWCV